MSSSEESEDDFVVYGTALEPLDEAVLPKKKAFTLEDQVAKDSKGRRRFHGAFTGGFSAGFMNTVGSLEGWKPSEFKSSRKEREQSILQVAEDFMDDEDIGEFGIAPKRLTARSDFAGSNSSSIRKRPIADFSEGPIPGTPVLEQILQPVRETVGVRLLKAMGWKPGQGVGPRLSKSEKKKVYGCSLPTGAGGEEDSDSDVEFESVTFAPDDIKPYVINPKKNTFGIGYVGLDRHSVLGSSSIDTALKFSDRGNKKVNIRGQAFGVGAFEEEDEDIYSKEDMSQYDFTLGGESSPTKKQLAIAAPGVVDGFVQAKTKVVKKSFPPPPIPKNFQPRKNFRKPSLELQPKATSEVAKPLGLGRHIHTPQSRAIILGERSMEIGSPAIEPATAELPSSAPLPADKSTNSGASSTSSIIGNSFRPFPLDPDKQSRYDQYLLLADKSKLSELQPVHLSEWEREREKREFEQAARIFMPLTGIMEDRFTRASQADDFSPLATVEKTKYGNETLRNAAKMKMFGKLTREEIDWLPCSLVCKRFNVPEPGKIVAAHPAKKTPKYSIFDSLEGLIKREPVSQAATPAHVSPHIDQPSSSSTSFYPASPTLEPSPSSDLLNTVIAEPRQPSRVEESLFTDPVSKVDLFKAIFLDSSDDEDNTTQIAQAREDVPYEEPLRNIERNKSPQRGLFAGIDLEALATRAENIPPPQPITVLTAAITPTESTEADLSYGPKLPQIIEKKTATGRTNEELAGDSWVEKCENRSKHKKQKRHKKGKSDIDDFERQSKNISFEPSEPPTIAKGHGIEENQGGSVLPTMQNKRHEGYSSSDTSEDDRARKSKKSHKHKKKKKKHKTKYHK